MQEDNASLQTRGLSSLEQKQQDDGLTTHSNFDSQNKHPVGYAEDLEYDRNEHDDAIPPQHLDFLDELSWGKGGDKNNKTGEKGGRKSGDEIAYIGDVPHRYERHNKRKLLVVVLIFAMVSFLFSLTFTIIWAKVKYRDNSSSSSKDESSTASSVEGTSNNGNSRMGPSDDNEDQETVPVTSTQSEDSRESQPEVPTTSQSEVPNISEICSVQNIATKHGYDSCEMSCQAAECCKFPETLDISCIKGNEMSCLLHHRHCAILDGYETSSNTYNEQQIKDANILLSTQQLPEAPTNLNELCSFYSLTTEDGFLKCKEACSAADCCYEQYNGITATASLLSQEQQPCSSHPNCEQFTPCFAMAAVDTINGQIQEEVDQKCSADNISTVAGRFACFEACAYATCCFDDNGPCPAFLSNRNDLHTSYCKQYKSCANLNKF